ncbi:glycoside hydrolase family 30 protein [Galbibacter mesophilus]|uniref:glycoside hydrolase family 30 protein n=1 Tax=Galbibacter mesophilus TaxID=379069 RepID=UPI00191DA0BC|nr:glycoside hydrolase family 30 beta sandwich domain-containing protein [Galbibacter mesophilus]MCM5664025.1 glucosylceramidase [Galbibacter mesophilus]
MFNFKNALLLGLAVSTMACQQKKEVNKEASLWVTTLDKKMLLKKTEIINDETLKPAHTITIDTTKKYQEMDGFGYSLTGGSAMLLHKMSDSARASILQEIFGDKENDINVSYLRVSIGASDLDEKTWSYNDLASGETDENLEQFTLAYDTLYLVPVLKEILKIKPNLKIMGSPWSPPTWIKTNNDARGGSLKEEYHQVYADYFVKYIMAMKSHGIHIDAVTIQNEPLHPGNNPSLLMLPEQQKEFVKNNLGPTFERHQIKTKIVVYDHNADRPDYPISILNDPEAAKFIDGSAFHLYGGDISALSQVHEAHPNKNLYFTEQWVGAPGDFAKELDWHTENLIIGAPRNWCKTVLEWNLAADENQDPHTDRGGCDRCLGAITIQGDKVTRNPAYYIIAQASKFVAPGSIRVASNTGSEILNVAYKTSKGVVSIIQNRTDKEQHIAVQIGGNNTLTTLPAKSVGTLVMD